MNSVTVTLTPNAGGSPISLVAQVQGTGFASINYVQPDGPPGLYTLTVSGPGITSNNSLPVTILAGPSFTLNPTSGIQGSVVQVSITPSNTTFGVGNTANFGPGISVGGAAEGIAGPVQLQGNGTLLATLTINPAAATGARTVQVINGATTITRTNAFTVLQQVGPLTLITINPASGPATTAVSINATGFVVNDTPTLMATLKLNGSGPGIPVAVTSIQGLGTNRVVNFTIPVGTAAGTYSVTLAGSGYTSANALSFTVTAPSFTLSPVSGGTGTTLDVTITPVGTTFPPGTTTANFGPGISVGGAAAGSSGPVVVQGNGTAVATLTIAAGAALGARTVQVNGLDTITRANAFTVNQNNTALTLISITPPSGSAGVAVSVNATGFIVNDTPVLTATLKLNGTGPDIRFQLPQFRAAERIGS